MPEKNYKTLTEDFKKSFTERLSSEIIKNLIASTKDAAADTGTFDVIVSTEDRDRQNEIVKQEGWDLSFYKLNPVVLWAHDYGALPIGVCTSIALEGNKLRAQGKFAPTEEAQKIRALYDGGYLKTTSVGFIPTEYDANDRDVVIKAQLLEFSFVPVPANPFALSLRQVKELKLDVPFLMTKGFKFDIKEAGAGDSCELDDGTPGILGADPKNPSGPLICIPKKSMHPDDAEMELDKAIEVFKSDYVRAHKDHHENHMKGIEVFKEALMDCMKDIDIGKAFAEKGVEVFKEAFEHHKEAIGLENQRHLKELEQHCMKVGKAIEVYRKCVKDYTDSHPEHVGDNPTADSVRMSHAVKDAYGHLEMAMGALKEHAGSEGAKGLPAEGSKSSAKDQSADVDKYVKNRDFLKNLNITLGQILREFNRQDKAAK